MFGGTWAEGRMRPWAEDLMRPRAEGLMRPRAEDLMRPRANWFQFDRRSRYLAESVTQGASPGVSRATGIAIADLLTNTRVFRGAEVS